MDYELAIWIAIWFIPEFEIDTSKWMNFIIINYYGFTPNQKLKNRFRRLLWMKLSLNRPKMDHSIR